MAFKFYTNQLSQATRGLAAGVFIVGMLLIGFAMLIFALPVLFGYLVAGVFCFIGLSVLGYAIKLFIAASRMDQNFSSAPDQEGQPMTHRKHVDATVQPSDDS